MAEPAWSAPVQICKLNSAKRLVYGYLSVAKTADGETVTDLQGDQIDPQMLEDAAIEYALTSREADAMHGQASIGKYVQGIVFTEEVQKALGIPEGVLPVGWFGCWKVEPETFEKVRSGQYRSFSIGGKAVRKEISDGD